MPTEEDVELWLFNLESEVLFADWLPAWRTHANEVLQGLKANAAEPWALAKWKRLRDAVAAANLRPDTRHAFELPAELQP